MKIGILQTGHAPDALLEQHGDYDDLFQRLLEGRGFTFRTWNVVDMAFPDSVSDADGWLVTGSKHGAYEDHPFITPLEDLIRDIYAAEVPMVGVCFGHQIIAQALGGKVEKFKGGWAVGRQTYDWQGREINLNAWHQDQVVVRPMGSDAIATNDFCSNAALIYDHRIFTVQPHPEFGNAFIGDLAEARGKGVVPDGQLAEVHANLDKPNHNAELADMMARFFKERSLQ